jgi:hypothetical protein
MPGGPEEMRRLCLSAVCGLRSAVCGLRSAVCGLRSAVCGHWKTSKDFFETVYRISLKSTVFL